MRFNLLVSHMPVTIVLAACASPSPPPASGVNHASRGERHEGRDPHGSEHGGGHGHGHGHGPGHADGTGHEHGHAHGHQHAAGEMPHRFENAEAWSKVFDEPARDAWQKPDEVVTLLALTPGSTVADLGAGTGYFMARLSRAVGPTGKVLGLDVEADMVRFMTERATKEGLKNVEARKVELADPGLAAGSVDRILVVDTWHHIESRGAYIPLLARALRPGGSVVVVDFTLESERGPPAKHRVSAEQVANELKAGGLGATILQETLPDQYVVRGVRRGS